jgi:hypothetical protein
MADGRYAACRPGIASRLRQASHQAQTRVRHGTASQKQRRMIFVKYKLPRGASLPGVEILSFAVMRAVVAGELARRPEDGAARN